MRLYHGTSESALTLIRKKGLRPRSSGKGNWQDYPSRKDMVYLTNAYALYFGINAAADDERAVVIEVDTDRINEDLLHPDEDFIAQALSYRRGVPMDQIHEDVRDNLEDYQSHWQMSIENMGNCCYQGIIPVSAFTRIAYFDRKKRSSISMMAMDPTISVINYRLCKEKYCGLLKWLFGDRPTIPFDSVIPDDGSEFLKKRKQYWDAESADRSGIQVEIL